MTTTLSNKRSAGTTSSVAQEIYRGANLESSEQEWMDMLSGAIDNGSAAVTIFGNLDFFTPGHVGHVVIRDISPSRLDSLPPIELPANPQQAQPASARTLTFRFDTVVEAQDHFAEQLICCFEEAEVEDGVTHSAEALIQGSLNSMGSLIVDGLKVIYAKFLEKNPPFAADLVLCLGRLPQELVFPWAMDMARQALASDRVDLREAGVRAFENWGGDAAVEAIQSYLPSESVSWLSRYAKQVLRDLAD